MNSVKFSKDDHIAIMESLEKQDYETFISYFKYTDLLVECDYMLYHSKYKLAPSENAKFLIGKQIYYVKITKMIKIQIQDEWAAFINGRIYYKLKDFQDFIDDFPKLKECTSKDLFLTEQTQWFISNTFQSKIQINPIEFYSDDSNQLTEDQYYTRAEYNMLKQQFKPHISQWKTYCICEKLYDPSKPYIQCDSCSEWIHYTCSGKSDKQLKNVSKLEFNCPQCTKRKSQNVDSKIYEGQVTKVKSLGIANAKRKN